MHLLKLSKIYINLLLVLILLFSLKMFQYTSVETLFFQLQAGFLFLLLIFMVIYIISLLYSNKPMKYFILYYIVLIILIPIYSAINAMIAFDQPLVYGFLSQRDWILIGTGIWLYYVMTIGKVTMTDIKSSFLIMTWGSLIIFSFIALTFDPSSFYASDEKSRYILVSGERGFRFKFQMFFITFGALYYFIKYTSKKKILDLLLLLLFLSYIVFIFQGRTNMLVLGITYLIYYYSNFSFSKFTVKIGKLFLFLLGSTFVIQIISPDYLEKMSGLYLQIFQMFSGTQVEDLSTLARVNESSIVTSYFGENPMSILFGTGRVSMQWNNGYESIFGYFFPSDLGILGGIFVYGVIGFIFIYLIPVLFSIKIVKKISNESDVFIISIKYLLINGLILSLQGTFYFAFMKYIIPLFILVSYLKIKEVNYAK